MTEEELRATPGEKCPVRETRCLLRFSALPPSLSCCTTRSARSRCASTRWFGQVTDLIDAACALAHVPSFALVRARGERRCQPCRVAQRIQPSARSYHCERGLHETSERFAENDISFAVRPDLADQDLPSHRELARFNFFRLKVVRALHKNRGPCLHEAQKFCH